MDVSPAVGRATGIVMPGVVMNFTLKNHTDYGFL